MFFDLFIISSIISLLYYNILSTNHNIHPSGPCAKLRHNHFQLSTQTSYILNIQAIAFVNCCYGRMNALFLHWIREEKGQRNIHDDKKNLPHRLIQCLICMFNNTPTLRNMQIKLVCTVSSFAYKYLKVCKHE